MAQRRTFRPPLCGGTTGKPLTVARVGSVAAHVRELREALAKLAATCGRGAGAEGSSARVTPGVQFVEANVEIPEIRAAGQRRTRCRGQNSWRLQRVRGKLRDTVR